MPRIVVIDPVSPEPEKLDLLVRHLDAGGVAAVPTDTLYGLAANALDPDAVARVFALKGREANKPLPVVVRDLEQAARLAARLPPLFHQLAVAYWPGPLTLIVAARPGLPPALTASTGTVAMRQPAAAILAGVLRRLDFPLTATSANRSGQPACREAAAVARQFGEELELIADGGPAPSALPSTIVDLTAATPRIVRPGAVPATELEAVWRRPGAGSPGQLLR